MKKSLFDKFMKMKTSAPRGGSGNDAYIIDAFFEEFIKNDPSEEQFIEMLTECLATAKQMYVLWKN